MQVGGALRLAIRGFTDGSPVSKINSLSLSGTGRGRSVDKTPQLLSRGAAAVRELHLARVDPADPVGVASVGALHLGDVSGLVGVHFVPVGQLHGDVAGMRLHQITGLRLTE